MLKIKDLTISNIMSFVEGNYKAHYVQLHNLPLLEQEQILYRFKICENTCLKAGECVKCFCSVPERMFIDKKIHECPYPIFLNEKDWNDFKTTQQYLDTITKRVGI